MFKDYYEILGINHNATSQQVKSAYRNMSKKWHPDINPDLDVTSIMQDINEAYAILKDEDKRKKYDVEYLNFKELFAKTPTFSNAQKDKSSDNYEVRDESLKEDINMAREYARKLVEDFMIAFRFSTKQAAEGAWDGVKAYIVGGIIASIVFALIRMCN